MTQLLSPPPKSIPPIHKATAKTPQVPQPSSRSGKSDITGRAAGAICAVHCAVTPILFAAEPVFHLAFPHRHAYAPWYWNALDLVFWLISLGAVWLSGRSNKSLRVWLWAAWGLFSIGLLGEQLEINKSMVLMYTGALVLIGLHLKNLKTKSCIA